MDWSKQGGSVPERVGRDVDLNLGNSVEADSGAESVSVNLCAEFRRDIVLDLRKRVAAASGREKLLGHLCADSGRGRDIDLNISKRVILVRFFGRNIGLNLSTRVEVTGNGFGSLQVSKLVDLRSLSSPGLDLYVDSSKRVDAAQFLSHLESLDCTGPHCQHGLSRG